MSSGQRLIVVRGLGDERQHLARLLARSLPGPVTHVEGEDLTRRWIVRGLPDPRQEVETVYRLLRLAAISYLKDGYSVVVDAPFVAQVEDITELRTQDILDLMRLARSFRGITTGVVTLETRFGVPAPLMQAIASDTIEGEVRVTSDLTGDDAQASRAILVRLGM